MPSSSPPLSTLSGGLDQLESMSMSPSSFPGTSIASTPSPRPRGTAADFIKVDWTLWGRNEWAKWPGLGRYTGGQGTRAWWQEYGYRVEDHSTSRQGNMLKWICADCFARGFKKKSDFCFICSTGVSIKKHLREAHGIQAPNGPSCRSDGQLLRDQRISRFMGADFDNPSDQFLIGNLRGQFDIKGLRMLLLDWIIYHNLPFETINTDRFQRILLYGNPLLDGVPLPSAKTLMRMLESEYASAIGPVTEVLQSARSQIHFSFDGWTSKSHTSFLGINAQFVDCDFAQHRILLGLRPLSSRHTGASLADEVSDTLAFWGINACARAQC